MATYFLKIYMRHFKNKIHILINIFFLILMAIYASKSLAQDSRCTDRKDCFSESGSTWNLINTDEQIDKAKLKLKKRFNDLIRLKIISNSNFKKLLIKHNEAWFKYTNIQCEFIGSTSGAGSHWPLVQTNECLLFHYNKRIEIIDASINCIEENKFDKKQIYDLYSCVRKFSDDIVYQRDHI